MDMEDKKHDTSFFAGKFAAVHRRKNGCIYYQQGRGAGADIILPVRTRTGRNEVKERPAAVYKMGLPEADDAQQKVPYILVKFLTGTDDKAAGEPEEDSCKVRIIFAVYSENGQDGPLALLNLMLRVRSELKKAGAVGGGQFVLEMPLEYIVYQDTTPPYYMGEMVTNWSLPVVQRDVAAVLQNL